MKLILLAAGTLLIGCVDTLDRLYSGIPQYQGRNIDALVDLIGYPDSQKFIAGRVVYTWTAASTEQMVLRPTPAVPMGAPGGPAFANRSEPEVVTLRFRCPLQVDTDGTGTILQLVWEGPRGSCP